MSKKKVKLTEDFDEVFLPSSAIIETKNVSVWYDDFKAIKSISMAIEPNPKNSLKSSKIGCKSLILKVLYQKGLT
jgi:ABC-type phosphate transport system ATPase subunit